MRSSTNESIFILPILAEFLERFIDARGKFPRKADQFRNSFGFPVYLAIGLTHRDVGIVDARDIVHEGVRRASRIATRTYIGGEQAQTRQNWNFVSWSARCFRSLCG